MWDYKIKVLQEMIEHEEQTTENYDAKLSHANTKTINIDVDALRVLLKHYENKQKKSNKNGGV